MARIRSIHPDACKSEKLAGISAEAERCYWRLQTACDDQGRCEDHARLIWAALFPLHETLAPADVDGWLQELADASLIVRYDVDGQRVIQVTNWHKYQHPQRPSKSYLPALPDTSASSNGASADPAASDLGDLPDGGEIGGGDSSAVVVAEEPSPPPESFRGPDKLARLTAAKTPEADTA